MLLIRLCLILEVLAGQAVASQYHAIDGLQCINPEFVETHAQTTSKILCASLCDMRVRCQAFSMADGPCQLFVFDRCSKQVRSCSCTRRAQVFVKQRLDLPAGALCSTGFADSWCGISYKFYSGINDWNVAKSTIDGETGQLTIMADVMDSSEMTYVHNLLVGKAKTSVILGGFQQPGSEEPGGGWYWVACNYSIDSSLWSEGYLDNYNGTDSIVVAGSWFEMLNDDKIQSADFQGALGECVSPFV